MLVQEWAQPDVLRAHSFISTNTSGLQKVKYICEINLKSAKFESIIVYSFIEEHSNVAKRKLNVFRRRFRVTPKGKRIRIY